MFANVYFIRAKTTASSYIGRVDCS